MLRLNVDAAWAMSVFYLSIRIGVLFILAPPFGSFGVPVNIRVLLVVALATALAGATGLQAATVPDSIGDLLAGAAGELLLGGMFAFGLFATFAAFSTAGRILDLQIGFGIANVIDPVTQRQAPLLGTALNILAVCVFLAADGHLLLLRAIAWSMEVVPPGAFAGGLDAALIVAQFGAVFSFAVALAAPVMIALLLIDIGLGVVSRSMPQVNVFIVALPVKVVAGVVLLAISLSYMQPLIGRIFESMFRFWQAQLR